MLLRWRWFAVERQEDENHSQEIDAMFEEIADFFLLATTSNTKRFCTGTQAREKKTLAYCNARCYYCNRAVMIWILIITTDAVFSTVVRWCEELSCTGDGHELWWVMTHGSVENDANQIRYNVQQRKQLYEYLEAGNWGNFVQIRNDCVQASRSRIWLWWRYCLREFIVSELHHSRFAWWSY